MMNLAISIAIYLVILLLHIPAFDWRGAELTALQNSARARPASWLDRVVIHIVPESQWLYVMRLIMAPLIIWSAVLIAWIEISNFRPTDFGDIFLLWFVLFLFTPVFAIAFQFYVRLLSPSGIRLLARDHRAPIVYLRSFKADAHIADSISDFIGESFVTNLPFIGGVLGILVGSSGRRFAYEQRLVGAVRTLGPIVAIGEPRESLPPLGAARLYVDGGNWEQVVVDLLSAAQLTVMRIGETKGFVWELNYVRSHCDPLKVAIFVPPDDRTLYTNFFVNRFGTLFSRPLPVSFNFIGPDTLAFVRFNQDWEPRLEGRDPGWAWNYSKEMRKLLTNNHGALNKS
jgi:hypothetical protein